MIAGTTVRRGRDAAKRGGRPAGGVIRSYIATGVRSHREMVHTGRILTCAVVVAWGASWLGAGPAMAERPNILFIYTDDQPYKTVGCYPEAPRWVRTPNIDRLAQSGVRFHRA